MSHSVRGACTCEPDQACAGTLHQADNTTCFDASAHVMHTHNRIRARPLQGKLSVRAGTKVPLLLHLRLCTVYFPCRLMLVGTSLSQLYTSCVRPATAMLSFSLATAILAATGSRIAPNAYQNTVNLYQATISIETSHT